MSLSQRERPVPKGRDGSKNVATERLSTPDQLDQVIQVARFPHWLALLALILVLAAGVAASFLVPVPITVRGQGILINAGGILAVTSETEGRLLELRVEPGDRVARGQVVARVDQPRLRRELIEGEEELAEAQFRRDTIRRFHLRTSQTQSQTLTNRRKALEQRLESAINLLHALEDQLAAETQLSRDGIFSARQVLVTQTEVDEARNEILGIENEVKLFVQVISDQELVHERELLESQLEISELERRLASLKAEYGRNIEVISPYSGRVVELKINPGEITERNGALFSLLPSVDTAFSATTRAAEELIAVLYVAPQEGKKIRHLMSVQLTLSSIKREEFGFMLGHVESVAQVPATTEGMMRVLRNRQLVDQLSGAQAPFEVRVSLARDASTPTGYGWSSSRGPDVEINVGTLCDGAVVTHHERLITLVIPALGSFFDG